VLDARREGYSVRVVEAAMRPVEVRPGDGLRAVEEMRQAGAKIVTVPAKHHKKTTSQAL